VITDVEVWRAANQLVQQHGNRAEWECCARVDAMIGRGDPDGEAVWTRVRRAIRDLQRKGRYDGEPVN
jgi:sirohydrochlorin ferrochelatase